VFTATFSVLNTHDDLERVTRAFDKVPLYRSDVQPALEIIENSANWSDRDGREIGKYLAEQK
jgi:hypothetical protein